MKGIIIYTALGIALVATFQNCAKNEAIKFEKGSIDAYKCAEFGTNCPDGGGGDGGGGGGGGGGNPDNPNDETDPTKRTDCSEGPFKFGLQNNNEVKNGQTIPWCNMMEVRYCFNNYLNASSGNYTQYGCTIPAVTQPSTRTCTLDGKTLKNGDVSVFFKRKLVSGTQNCIGQIRVCSNGSLTGSTDFSQASCGTTEFPVPEGGAKDCNFNGATVAEGSTIVGYLEPAPSAGKKECVFTVKRCIDGQLDRPEYKYSGCNPPE